MAVLTAFFASVVVQQTLGLILDSVFKAAGKSYTDWLEKVRAEQALRDLGAANVTNTINKESADAERRASEVAVNQPDVDAALDQWAKGKPF